jgi:hypothetical protein
MKGEGNKQGELKIEWVDIDDLRPSEYNPRNRENFFDFSKLVLK